MAKKPKTKSTRKTRVAKRKPAPNVKRFTPEIAQLAGNIMLRTGIAKSVYEELGVAKTTFFAWRKKHPELEESLALACERRRKYIDKEFMGETDQAFTGLNELLIGMTKTLTKTEREVLIDDKTGKETKVLKVKTSEQEHYYRPDMRAIEKVLGPHGVRFNVYLKAIEDHVLEKDSELYKLVFGELAQDETFDQFTGVFVLRVQVDMVKIRLMEAMVQREYDRGNISIDQWVDFTAKLRRDYTQISDRMETRAQKLLDGHSYQEVVLRVEDVWRSVIGIVEENIGKTYKREGGRRPYTIPADIQKLVMFDVVTQIRTRGEKKLSILKNVSVS